MLALLFAGAFVCAQPLTKLDSSGWRIEEAFMDAAGNHLFHLRKGDFAVREAWHPAAEHLSNLYSLVTLSRERTPEGLRYAFRAPTAQVMSRVGQVVVEPTKLRVTCDGHECVFIRVSDVVGRAWMNMLEHGYANLYDQTELREIYAVLKVPNVDEYFVIDRPGFRPTSKSFVHTGAAANFSKVEIVKWGGLRGQADLRLADGRRLLIEVNQGRATLFDGEAEVRLLVKSFGLDEVDALGFDTSAFRAERIRSPASAPYGCEDLLKAARRPVDV